MANNTEKVTINLSNQTELEFEVIIQGLDDGTIPKVRFVIVNTPDDCDYSFNCTKVSGEKNKWVAKIPSLPHLDANDGQYCIEVITDDYYFVPAKGNIHYLSSPKVKVVDKKKKTQIVSEETIDEVSGGGEVTGQYAPTNSLLIPEEDPSNEHRMKGNQSKHDEFIDVDRLDLGTEESQETNDEDTASTSSVIGFDPRKVAENILKQTIGAGVKKPSHKGSLFKRSQSGKVVVDGLDDVETTNIKNTNAQKVRDILQSVT